MTMPRPKPGDLLGLVDVDKGIVSREIFVNEEIYRQEQERMFARAWLFVGHESQITRPGDYLVSSMGEESVILCRDRAGRIHVFLNSCRHRGMKVCRYDEGNTVELTCPYHGWSYATDGALVGVPFAKDAYGEHLDRSRWGLVEVAQLESYKGTVWTTWDPSAPSFLEYLGGYKLYLDLLLDAWDGREGGTEVIGGIHKPSTCAWRRSLWNSSRWRRLRQSACQRSLEMPYSDEADERSAGRRSEMLEKLLVPVAVVGHVLFYDVLPALLTWVVGSTAGLDLFSAIDNPSLRRLAGLGLFLSVVAAIITTESVTRLARPFSIGHFLTTVVLIGAALFPTLADWHRLRLGLTPEQFALVQAYCYLALKVMVGILIGATLSWILQARYARLVSSRRPEYTRK